MLLLSCWAASVALAIRGRARGFANTAGSPNAVGGPVTLGVRRATNQKAGARNRNHEIFHSFPF